MLARPLLLAAMLCGTAAFHMAGVPVLSRTKANLSLRGVRLPIRAGSLRASPMMMAQRTFDMEALINESKEQRLKHLEQQAMDALKVAVENLDNAVFPNAMIAGDCVITHLLDRLGYLKSGKVKIMVVDTFHLFPETMTFLAQLEKHYGFKAEIFCAAGTTNKAEYDKKYGADLWKIDIEQYDKVCKVEPFQRGLKTLNTGVMINGRRRDHGVERAYINLFENAPIGGGMAKVNPLAYWTFEDCFDYIAKYKIPIHPLHAQGFPSIGDAKDTVKVPADGSVKFVNFKFEGKSSEWLDYAAERKGRFVGLVNKDGSTKTECGIHVAGAEKTFERDLWDGASKVKGLTKSEAEALPKGGKAAVVAIYAPWCKFCQGMEKEFEQFAAEVSGKITVAKYRGDEDRDFVGAVYNTKSFPTINIVTPEGKVIKYECSDPSCRTVAGFKKFVADHAKVPA